MCPDGDIFEEGCRIDKKVLKSLWFFVDIYDWTFEAISHIRKTFKEFNEEVSSPRLLRWLATSNNAKVEAHELFDPSEDEIVYPWLIPTESEKEMDFWTGFVPLEQKEEDPRILKLVTDLAGVTTIKRNFNVDVGVGAAVGDAAGTSVVGAAVADVGVDAAGIAPAGVATDEAVVGEEAAAVDRGGFSSLGGGSFQTPFNVDNFDDVAIGSSNPPCGSCTCETCNDRANKMMEKIESIEQTLNTLISKRGVIPSSRLVSPYTSVRVQRRRRQVSQAVMSARKRTATKRLEQQTTTIREEQEATTATEEQQPATSATEEQQLLG